FRFGAAFDLSVDTLNFNSGGGTLDTNTFSPTFANNIGNNSANTITKTGGGTLTITKSILTTSAVDVINGTLALNNTNVATPNTAIGAGGLFIGGPLSVTTASTTNSVILNASNQINDSAPVTIEGVTGSMSTVFNLNNFSEAIGALSILGGTQTA